MKHADIEAIQKQYLGIDWCSRHCAIYPLATGCPYCPAPWHSTDYTKWPMDEAEL